MIEKPTEIPANADYKVTSPSQRVAISALAWSTLCAAGFVLCILVSVTLLKRIPDAVIHLHTPLGEILAGAGAWLPPDLGLTSNAPASRASSAYVTFVGLIALSFVFYGLYAWIITRQPARSSFQRQVRRLTWPITILAGLIYVFSPAMLSHDILVYASYSRLLATYHANPYFVPLSAFPHDPYVPLNYWSGSVAAYGPLWLLVCGVVGFVVGPAGLQPFSYVLAYRLLALVAHLLNTWLVGRTLEATDQSPRTVTLGMTLYALNPLVLLESSLGGHNDVVMMTFLLIGALLAARAEQSKRLLMPGGYLPPLIAFTLATLVKFTVLPVVALYIILLACKARHDARVPAHLTRADVWMKATRITIVAAGVALLVALAFYGPFWLGHSLSAIHTSLTSPPSAQFAENSILRAVVQWSRDNMTAVQRYSNLAIRLLSTRYIWDDINYIVIVVACLLGAIALWRSPTFHTWLLASLAVMGTLLIATPWFYSWYITWLVALAALSVPLRWTRAGRALLAFTLTFSVSALLTYLFLAGAPPFGPWTGLDFLLTTSPPILVMLIVMIHWRLPEKSSGVKRKVGEEGNRTKG